MTSTVPHFRKLARESLERAKAHLATASPHRLRYAALELRDAMESLTYDRALAFKDDIPPEEYKTWQPRKLMAVLIEIDPSINITKTISFSPQSSGDFTKLGTDHVFTLADLKTHYDAIGSYLHTPSVQQLLSGQLPDPAKLRSRCEEVAALIEKCLSSRISNTSFGYLATLDQCMNSSCKKPVRKRVPIGNETVHARCFECNLEYTLTPKEGSTVVWEPKVTQLPCPTPGCSQKVSLWNHHQVQPGADWTCQGCGVHYMICLSVTEFVSRN